ncbi:MAG: efflux RND transporter periplasmic adaptor subunit [Bacteroidales bacterium]|nr:efflux RND transporter periplasmic adaptor subunit [Bacteroidales bacterium]
MRKTVALAIITSGLILYSCSSKSSKTEQNKHDIYVKTYTLNTEEGKANKNFVGVVQEDIAAAISFPLAGNIAKLNVSEGQYIQKGQILTQLNPYSLENAHKATLATLMQAEDAMKRVQMLYDKQSLPEIQYIEMLSNLEQAKAAEAIARKNLKDSKLYAPFSGMIGRISIEMGENVLPNQTVLTLLKIDKVAVKISVPEKEVNRIQLGQQASIKVSAANEQTFTGEVFEKGIVADPISHTYPLRIRVANPNDILLPGMVSDVTITDTQSTQILTIPNRCVLRDGAGNFFVWKVINKQAHKQIIQTGSQRTGGVEVTKGLLPGDEVITDGYQKVSNGLNVVVL